MKKRASLWALFTTMAFAVAALAFTPAGEAVADTMKPLLVRVINDSSAPVPVTGTTSISGTPDVNVLSLPAVQAQQSGAWAVGILGTPTVNVANLPSGTPVRGNFFFGSPGFVAADTILTDIFGRAVPLEANEAGFCGIRIMEPGSEIVTYPVPNPKPNGAYSLNLTTGLRGPLELQVVSSPGGCGGVQLWTGITQ